MHRSPNTRDPRETKTRNIIIKMAKIKDKERVSEIEIRKKEYRETEAEKEKKISRNEKILRAV